MIAQMQTPRRLPSWFKGTLPDSSSEAYARTLTDAFVHTVCHEAHCPNQVTCAHEGHCTFMLLGPQCTRACRFCVVKKATGAALEVERDQSQRITTAVKRLGLSYVIITSVTRDDLSDGGAGVFAKTIACVKRLSANMRVEVLIPDFLGNKESVRCVAHAQPVVVAHNIETVPRLYASVRPQADYCRSLEVLRSAKEVNPMIMTKSSLMVGLGETKEEVFTCLKDLRSVDCDILTIGQYLAPTPDHYPVQEFIDPERFEWYELIGEQMSFRAVASGPLVRSSFRAQEMFERAFTNRYPLSIKRYA